MQSEKPQFASGTIVVTAHILATRALVLGAETLNEQDWEIAKQHISQCPDCRKKLGVVAELSHQPLWNTVQENLHPSIEELMAYTAPEANPHSPRLDDSGRFSIREHLRICNCCRETHTYIHKSNGAWDPISGG